MWVLFSVLVVVVMVIDLGVVNRHSHVIRPREALIWVVVWISLALVFNVIVGFMSGVDRAIEFFTGYVVEYALSVDNLFVFVIIFSYFGVPAKLQHRVLFWGIVGAVVMRLTFIFVAFEIIQHFAWVEYILGALLAFLGLKLLLQKEVEVHPERNPVLRVARRLFRCSNQYDEDRFFTRVDGRKAVTPLFLVLLVVEATDVVFAIDSVPAIIGVTSDRFVAFSSNIFAILGLRSLYFVLSGMMMRFHYLQVGLSLVLMFIGAKLIAKHFLEEHISKKTATIASLVVVCLLVGGSVLLSILLPPKRAAKPADDEA
jgi:tellurite resistance protein TerC